MAYNPYRASYGLPPPILPSAGKPVPQGMAPMQPTLPPPPPLKAPFHIQNPQPNMSASSNHSINRSVESVLPENFRPENLVGNRSPTVEEQRNALKAFNPQRIREIKGSRRAQQMVSSALAAAGGTSPSAPESSPARTASSNPPSKNGSTESLFGGISPIAKVENNNKRKRKTRKTRKIKQSRKSQKQLKNRKHK